MVSVPHKCIPVTETSHPHDPIPHEPESGGVELKVSIQPRLSKSNSPAQSSQESLLVSENTSDSEAPSTPLTDVHTSDGGDDVVTELSDAVNKASVSSQKRPSTNLVTHNSDEIRKLLGDGETTTKLIQKYCCGGGCCKLKPIFPTTAEAGSNSLSLPDNAAFQSLNLSLGALTLDTELSSIPELPPPTVSFDKLAEPQSQDSICDNSDPPHFLQPHPPYNVFSAPVSHARELTKPGAEKRTFHFDLDVTDYPEEGGVDFKVGGAIGVCPPNANEVVDDIFDRLGILKHLRDKPISMTTAGGRWPTIWGEEQPRTLITTRRQLFTWCLDVQSSAPTKHLLRTLAEYADDESERKILMYLTSAEGQSAFCE